MAAVPDVSSVPHQEDVCYIIPSCLRYLGDAVTNNVSLIKIRPDKLKTLNTLGMKVGF